MIEIHDALRNTARVAGQERWLDELPALLDDLAREWGLTIGGTYAEGTEAHVCDVVLDDGTAAVLKLTMPRPAGIEHEVKVLDLAAGHGCPRLLRHDVDRSAILLERLGPSMFRLGLPMAERHEHLVHAAEQLWQPAPDAGLPTGAEKGRWLVEFITDCWERLGRPCSERTVDYTIACAERRMAQHDDERAVLVHGDVHQWNALQAPDGTFKLVDPDGLLADAEYDLGIIMREDPDEGDPRERARWLAQRTGLDETRIWEWGAVERLSTALLGIEEDLQPGSNQMLAVAERISGC